MAGTATGRKWHPALDSGNALREEIDKGELASPEQVEPELLRGMPVVDPEPVKKQEPLPEESADDGLPAAAYVETEDALQSKVSPPPPEAFGPSPELLEMQRQLQEERLAREQLLAQMAEMEEERQRAALAQDIYFDDSELSLTDPTEAQLIAQKAAEAADRRSRLAMLEMEKKLRADLEKQYATQAATNAKQAEDQKWERINTAILTLVPEAQDIMKTPTYRAYANQRLEDGSTRLSRLQSAYVDGNTDYIVKVLNKVKSALPDFAEVTRVMPNTPGGKVSAPSGVSSGNDVDDASLSSMLSSVITGGREDREKFRAIWAAKANKAAEASPQS